MSAQGTLDFASPSGEVRYQMSRIRVSVIREPMGTEPGFSSPKDPAKVITDYTADRDQEVFVVLHLDAKHRVRGLQEVTVGSINETVVHPRETFRGAIIAGAAAIIIGHNHPSGDPEPSPADIAVTRRLAEAGRVIGIELLDHVIVGDPGNYVSLKERGIIR